MCGGFSLVGYCDFATLIAHFVLRLQLLPYVLMQVFQSLGSQIVTWARVERCDVLTTCYLSTTYNMCAVAKWGMRQFT